MLSILRQSNHRDRFFKIFPHIPLKKKRSRRNFVHGLRSLSLTRQPTFSHILLLVVGKYDEFQKRWLWNLPQRESQKCYDHFYIKFKNYQPYDIKYFYTSYYYYLVLNIILLFWKAPLGLNWDCNPKFWIWVVSCKLRKILMMDDQIDMRSPSSQARNTTSCL